MGVPTRFRSHHVSAPCPQSQLPAGRPLSCPHPRRPPLPPDHLNRPLPAPPRPGNHLAICRIHCATGNWQAAEAAVSSSKSAAAAFHLARLYEAGERPEDAVRCYALAGRHAHGARLAKRCAARRGAGMGGSRGASRGRFISEGSLRQQGVLPARVALRASV